VGALLVGLGLVVHARGRRWLGLTFLIVGFSEMAFWTCPTFLGSETREFDRLLANKLVLSSVSLVLLGLGVRLLGAFREPRPS
jgi:hypothetical protein